MNAKRRAAKTAAAVPSGPVATRVLVRNGVAYRVRACPGVGGALCVRSPASWLMGRHRDVCAGCVALVQVPGANVSIKRARSHLLKLRRRGVGYKSVAAACDVSAVILWRIIVGRKLEIRASTERRILAVDAEAIADGAKVLAGATRRLIQLLLDEGFTRKDLARHLGCTAGALRICRRPRVLASTALRVRRLYEKLSS